MKNLFLVFLFGIQNAFGANILYVASVPSGSHHIWNRALAFGLANKGHNVTFFGPDKDKVYPENCTHIFIDGAYESYQSDFDQYGLSNVGPTELITDYSGLGVVICEATIKSQGLQKLLDYPSDFKFDGLIIDTTLGPCLYPLIHKFNYPPTVVVTPFLLPSYVAYNLGNHLYPAYVPWYGFSYNSKMSFMERLWNFLTMYGEVFYRYNEQYKVEHQIAKTVFGEDIPSMEELERHVSVVLTNSDPVLDNAQPLAPNFIPVGGLHTYQPKQIPQDFQPILDNAKDGVVIFSLGSVVRSDKLDHEKQQALLDAFSKIPQTVIWKFESDIENVPKNVIVRKWLPQNDILSHPNVRLFITHGGALSIQETIFHGVPVISVPFFLDQYINTKNIVDRKLGIQLDYRRITSEYVLEKLNEILDNPLYAKNMQKVSQIFRDRKETPLERGIFWIEYVMRHKGANFLSTPARDLPFYVSSGLDIVTFLAFIIVLTFFIFYKSVKFLIKFCINGTDKPKIKIN